MILPVRNESAYIESGLLTIFAQDYPKDLLEIIVVDGMSTDDTREIVSRLTSQHEDMSVKILDNPNNIVSTALNIGIMEARGEIIIRVDGHSTISPDYVRQCVDILAKTNASNVGGKMNAVGNNLFGKTVALATSTPFGIGSGRFHYSNEEEYVDTVYMGAWPRSVFEKVGLFDEELIRDQDDEFNYRIRKAGGKILLSPLINSKYNVRSSPIKLWIQYFQYGYWKVRVLQKQPRQMSLRQFVPPAFVLALIVSLVMNLSSTFRPFSSIVILAYLLVNLSVSVFIAFRRNWKCLPILPGTFAILHISYGLGFLIGLIKFWNRWGDKSGKTPSWTNEANG